MFEYENEQGLHVRDKEPAPDGFLNETAQNIDQLNKYLDDVRGRLGRLADRVFGDTPASGAGGSELGKQVRLGAAGTVAAGLGAALSTSRLIHEQLKRLEGLA